VASARQLGERLQRALERGANDALNYTKSNLLRGGKLGEKRDGQTPLALRSGALMESLVAGSDGPMSAYVGSTKNTGAGKYNAVILGDGSMTIRHKNAAHLWLPLPDNQDPSGVTKLSPRDAMAVTDSKGHRLLRIFKSRAGNLVAFMPDHAFDDETGHAVRTGKKWARGPRNAGQHGWKLKGQLRGQLLFVLKDTVTVQGSDALAKGVMAKIDAIRIRIMRAVSATVLGAEPGADTAGDVGAAIPI
jgi:hypothetical protein